MDVTWVFLPPPVSVSSPWSSRLIHRDCHKEKSWLNDSMHVEHSNVLMGMHLQRDNLTNYTKSLNTSMFSRLSKSDTLGCLLRVVTQNYGSFHLTEIPHLQPQTQLIPHCITVTISTVGTEILFANYAFNAMTCNLRAPIGNTLFESSIQCRRDETSNCFQRSFSVNLFYSSDTYLSGSGRLLMSGTTVIDKCSMRNLCNNVAILQDKTELRIWFF